VYKYFENSPEYLLQGKKSNYSLVSQL